MYHCMPPINLYPEGFSSDYNLRIVSYNRDVSLFVQAPHR
jgi:hypothetical protein